MDRIRRAPITFALAAINTAVFLFVEWHGSSTDAATLLRFGAVEPAHVWAGEVWRLATYMFLHVGWVHFLWNTYASFGVCMPVERELGQRRFLAVYLLSGIAGGAASTLSAYPVSAGASGAMFGIVGATLAIQARRHPSIRAALADPTARATLSSIALWTLIGMTALPMNNRAHFGGLVAGAIATWIFVRRQTWLWALYGVAYALLLFVATKPWLRGLQTPQIPVDEAKGAQLVDACERGNRAACHAFTITLPANVGDTTRELEPMCTSFGDQDACAAWGWTLVHGRAGVSPDPARGAAILRDACSKGSTWGCALADGGAPVTSLPPL
jgi:rhomboid protease GluP